jgi:hypothetical protein
MTMATKPDSDARALLNAMCDWLVHDANFMPDYVKRLRDRFEMALAARNSITRDSSVEKARSNTTRTG